MKDSRSFTCSRIEVDEDNPSLPDRSHPALPAPEQGQCRDCGATLPNHFDYGELDRCPQLLTTAKPQGLPPYIRLLDLVRYCRHDLHDEGLITDDEFAALVEVGSESARRLETYDEVRAALTGLVNAGSRVLAGLDARIRVPSNVTVPVFDGIADLHGAINVAKKHAQ